MKIITSVHKRDLFIITYLLLVSFIQARCSFMSIINFMLLERLLTTFLKGLWNVLLFFFFFFLFLPLFSLFFHFFFFFCQWRSQNSATLFLVCLACPSWLSSWLSDSLQLNRWIPAVAGDGGASENTDLR